MTSTTRETSMLRTYAPRLASPLVLAGVLAIVASAVFPAIRIGLAGMALIVVGVALYFVRAERDVTRPPVTVRAPVRGRWIAVNTPADKVPSHGTRELGQTYAIDLVYQPDPDVTWQSLYRWPPARRPASFPGFGQPILAPADGVVVKATGWQRDHWSRNSPLGIAYLIPEMLLRALPSLANGHFVIGNHVILDLGDGVYALFAHLRRGSIRVRRGQHVRAGEQLAECGNSGNTSEPHLHFHLMDRSSPAIAAGLPFSFDQYAIHGRRHSGVPAGQIPFVVEDEQ